MWRTHYRYTQYVNRLHGRSGHLWQNRFHSCALDEDHYWTAMAYVEQNPVRARLVRARLVRGAWRYPWSSAVAHCGLAADRWELLDLVAWRGWLQGSDWQENLAGLFQEQTLSTMRRNTHRGRPLGNDRFLSKVESLLGRRLRALPVGRPRKRRKKPVTVPNGTNGTEWHGTPFEKLPPTASSTAPPILSTVWHRKKPE